jgi:hypothetical protein
VVLARFLLRQPLVGDFTARLASVFKGSLMIPGIVSLFIRWIYQGKDRSAVDWRGAALAGADDPLSSPFGSSPWPSFAFARMMR